ncbi:type II toxin-antitoxin system Phd/YefM family antitoxin [Nitratifractor sp.]
MEITATELKQKSYLLDEVKREDIVVTKRSRPFAVIIDIDRYHDLLQRAQSGGTDLRERDRLLERSAGILDLTVEPERWQRELRASAERDPYQSTDAS